MLSLQKKLYGKAYLVTDRNILLASDNEQESPLYNHGSYIWYTNPKTRKKNM